MHVPRTDCSFSRKLHDTPICVLHEIANIQTIRDYIANSLKTAYHTEHQNLLSQYLLIQSNRKLQRQQHPTKNQEKAT